MNEIQIIEQQLATERLHFAQVAGTLASRLDNAMGTDTTEFVRACGDYFVFALERLDATDETARKLEAARVADAASADRSWREFLQSFNGCVRQHFARLDVQLTRLTPVTRWRALSGISADSIFSERARFEQVRATLPPGTDLAAQSDSPP